jgi:YfiH family protein
VLLADARIGTCAAVHAGWRGVVAGVVPAALREMATLGTSVSDVVVALGPCIGPCCFEVGPEVVGAFDTSLPAARDAGAVADRAAGKAHVDLRAALRAQLLRHGVGPERVDAELACTRCDPSRRFFSYRRDAQRTGQQVGFIVRMR